MSAQESALDGMLAHLTSGAPLTPEQRSAWLAALGALDASRRSMRDRLDMFASALNLYAGSSGGRPKSGWLMVAKWADQVMAVDRLRVEGLTLAKAIAKIEKDKRCSGLKARYDKWRKNRRVIKMIDGIKVQQVQIAEQVTAMEAEMLQARRFARKKPR